MAGEYAAMQNLNNQAIVEGGAFLNKQVFTPAYEKGKKPITIRNLIKEIKEPTLFKGIPLNTDISLIMKSIKNIVDKKPSTPMALPKSASERKAHADKIRAQIEKEIERQRKVDESWGVRRGDSKDPEKVVTPNDDYKADSPTMPKNLDYTGSTEVGNLPKGNELLAYGDKTALSEVIASHESKGNYNIFNQGVGHQYKVGTTDFASMPVSKVMQLQNLGKTHPEKLFAVGKYQIIPKTMQGIVNDPRSGIKPTDKFNPETQDKMLSYLLQYNRPAIYKFITGSSDDIDKSINHLAYEWASMQNTKGKGMYDGDGVNSAHTKLADIKNSLLGARARYKKYIGDGMSPEQAFIMAVTGKADEAKVVKEENPDVGTNIPPVSPTPSSDKNSTTDSIPDAGVVKEADSYQPKTADQSVVEADNSGLKSIPGNNDNSSNTQIPRVEDVSKVSLKSTRTLEIPSTPTVGVDSRSNTTELTAPVSGGDAVTERARKAAAYAEQRFGSQKPKGKCAWGVRTILEEGGGYKLNPFGRDRSSAYMYHTNNILKESGFVLVGNSPKLTPMMGDVMVWMPYKTFGKGGRIHGHIQIWTGKRWVSDGGQLTVYPNSANANLFNSVPCYLYRDNDSSIKPEFSEAQVDDSKPDGPLQKPTISGPMSMADDGSGSEYGSVTLSQQQPTTTMPVIDTPSLTVPSPVATPETISDMSRTTTSSPTSLMMKQQNTQAVKNDTISLAKTEELLAQQVKLQEENNRIISDILTTIKMKETTAPTSRNTNQDTKPMDGTTSGSGRQERTIAEPVRTGPINTKI